MTLRALIAPAWLAAWSLWRGLAPPAARRRGFRVLLLHDTPRTQWAAFARLIDRLQTHYRVIAPDEAARLRAGADDDGSDGRAPVLLSFDDGFASNLALAEDVLAGSGIRALFFVCPGLVDLPPDEQRRAIAERIFDGRVGEAARASDQRLMTWAELARLRDLGHAIGAHGMSHRRLAGLDADTLEAEVAQSGARMEAALGARPHWFAWPFGDIGSIDEAALAAIARHYPLCRSGVRGLNAFGDVRMPVLADHLDLATPWSWQRLVLDGALDAGYRAARERLAAMAAERAHPGGR